MNIIPKAIQSAKNNFFKDVNKVKVKERSKYSHQYRPREMDNRSIPMNKDMNNRQKHEFFYTTEIISEESELKYVENDEDATQERTCFPNNSDVFEFETFQEANAPEDLITKFKGDGITEKWKEQLSNLIVENQRINQMNTMQKNQIERLLLEIESVKEINISLVSKNDENTQYLSRTIEILQKKITELNGRLETHQINSAEKEKSIKQLLELLQGIPKKLNNAMNGTNNQPNLNCESLLTEVNSSVHKDLSASFPMLKINYKTSTNNHSIKVLCRIKPHLDNCLSVPNDDMVYLPPFKHFDKGLGYRLNKVLGPTASQSDVFKEINPILPYSFNGCNVCIISYGQSGSGKTHTMIGSKTEPGIMLLCIKELFKITNENNSTIYKFYMTILEIYNENIYDLMSTVVDKNSVHLKARVFLQDNGHSVQVKDVSEAEVSKEVEFSYYINQSLKRRSSSITVKNINSSRSHYLVMIRVSGMSKDDGIIANRGSLIMCDLAGSENCSGLSNQEQTESKFINKSITMLNRVFDSMYRKSPTIPFRDSKLTHLLKPSLMGNAKCIFIATVCSQPEHISDTYRTLNVAKKVEMINFNEKSEIP